MNSVVDIKNVFYSYENIPVLEDITLNINERDFAGIVGPNGGGKTTLLKLILGLLSPRKGAIKVLGKNPAEVRNLIGYVPQYGTMADKFPVTAYEVVEMGLYNSSFESSSRSEKLKRIKELFSLAGLNGLEDKPFFTLSGGQQQRTLIARALVSDPEIILLDEPTASVDSSSEIDIYELLKKLNKEKTILLVSHDVAFISTYINRVICVNKRLACHSIDEIKSENVKNNLYNIDVNFIQHSCGL